MKIMFIGDIYGKLGVDYFAEKVDFLKKTYQPNFIIVNAENADNGAGLSYKIYQKLQKLGVNLITMGNHVWKNKQIKNFIDKSNVIRPVNDIQQTGQGYKIVDCVDKKILVMNALGRVFINSKLYCPFKTIENVLEQNKSKYDFSFLDFHAEATSEKIALTHYFDGRINAIVGTHTHVQTNDERLFPRKTLYISDVGMTGAKDGVIGKKKEPIIQSFLGNKVLFRPNEQGKRQLNGVVVTLYPEKKIEKINLSEE
ncbi:TIGR00282 family metallophosphoesterase [Candidatus Phytoplasma meliae]|uniref:TIGR00282 family metallophosphoesterase n=1 Tax=Candidatus Phytoplasma meliae TaxID=1848402 RepID=A0ABS5CXR1_9MOLU|nr:TIGR00282 family metallophosphoesterase [Candidatus Phytoplasma meliae]MBP5835755.1 TIGR00282 family metallophosphoesterase [Candidatus Phytoplasma meliae]